ncbi:MAG TPA: SDR family oxidoreductase [Solirubrobacterales bacterium]
MAARAIKDVSYDFSGRVVVVTGAARGLGRAHALGFAAAGADLVISDIAAPIEAISYGMASKEDLNAVAEEIRGLGARCLTSTCDVRDETQVEAMIDAALSEFGQIDVLLNNAGANGVVSLEKLDRESWSSVLDSQLLGAFNCCKLAAASMVERKKGTILVTGSAASFVAVPENVHYTAAKHGLLGLVRGLAVELAPHGINVNMVCPGAIRTGMSDGMGSASPKWVGGLGELTGTWNLFEPNQMLEPEEVTNAMLWLASDAAAFVTGVALPVDAGYLVK